RGDRGVQPNEREHGARGIGARGLRADLPCCRATRASGGESAWLEVLADVDAERGGDRNDCERGCQQSPGVAVDEAGESAEHGFSKPRVRPRGTGRSWSK